MAYFGPNAKILGNIQLAIWQFQIPISNIESYIFNISILMIFDVCSLVLNGTLLWVFCNINVLKILKILQQNYWILFAIAEGYLFMEVKKPILWVFWIVYALLLFFLQLFQVQAIGAGHDLTLEFDWINGKNASVWK